MILLRFLCIYDLRVVIFLVNNEAFEFKVVIFLMLFILFAGNVDFTSVFLKFPLE